MATHMISPRGELLEKIRRRARKNSRSYGVKLHEALDIEAGKELAFANSSTGTTGVRASGAWKTLTAQCWMHDAEASLLSRGRICIDYKGISDRVGHNAPHLAEDGLPEFLGRLIGHGGKVIPCLETMGEIRRERCGKYRYHFFLEPGVPDGDIPLVKDEAISLFNAFASGHPGKTAKRLIEMEPRLMQWTRKRGFKLNIEPQAHFELQVNVLDAHGFLPVAVAGSTERSVGPLAVFADPRVRSDVTSTVVVLALTEGFFQMQTVSLPGWNAICSSLSGRTKSQLLLLNDESQANAEVRVPKINADFNAIGAALFPDFGSSVDWFIEEVPWLTLFQRSQYLDLVGSILDDRRPGWSALDWSADP